MNRRKFLEKAALGTAAALGGAAGAGRSAMAQETRMTDSSLSLSGTWAFRRDTTDQGAAAGWAADPATGAGWKEAVVPGCWERDGQPGTFAGPA